MPAAFARRATTTGLFGISFAPSQVRAGVSYSSEEDRCACACAKPYVFIRIEFKRFIMKTLSPTPRRHGISTIELLGCGLSIAGGIWIGALYLGLDLNRAAYQALDETELLTQIPDEWRPVNPDCPDGDCPDPAEVRKAEQLKLFSELDALRREVARLQAGAKMEDESSVIDQATQETSQLTMDYWQRLHEVIGEVSVLQDRVKSIKKDSSRPRVLAVKHRSYAYGKKAIELLDSTGVDTRAVETGLRVAEWYGQSEALLTQAAELSGNQTVAGRSLSADQVWTQTQKQHRKQTDLVRRKVEDSYVYLRGRYMVDFPQLEL